MYLIGLTGGIAAGKSTVADYWQTLGGFQIDADQLAREAVEPGSAAAAKIAEEFGADAITTDGSINRPKLAEIVFADPTAREKLEAIIHPEVRRLMLDRMSKLPADTMVIYNVPLLVEAASDLEFDTVVTVEAPVEKQIERMVKHRGMTSEAAQARIAAQATPAERANRADFIINSNQDLELMLRDARLLWGKLETLAAQKDS